jgi:pimeloyl-ACP methyl ester carboxylesterase
MAGVSQPVGGPVLFVNGTGGPGAYFAPLLRELRGFRCLVLDRPGWGLSAPVDYSRAPYRTLTVELLRQALDALEVDRARAVGGSVGNLWVLRLAQAHPGRVERVVLLGGGPLTGEIGVPPFVRLLRSPLGRIIARLPERRRMLDKQLARWATLPARSRRSSPSGTWPCRGRPTGPATSATWSGSSSVAAATRPAWCWPTPRPPPSASPP